MSIFSKLADLFRFGPGGVDVVDKPFGLNGEQLRAIDDLRHSDEWPVYLKLLDNLINLKAENLLVVDAEKVDYWRGYIAGLRAAAYAPTHAISQKEGNDARRERELSRTERSDDRFAASLYGSPAWGRTERTGAAARR